MLSWAFASLGFSPSATMDQPSLVLLSCASAIRPSRSPGVCTVLFLQNVTSTLDLRSCAWPHYRVFFYRSGGVFSLEIAVPF